MGYSGSGTACDNNAGIAVVEYWRFAWQTGAFSITEFLTIASIAVGAGYAGSYGLMHNTKNRIARVDGAHIAVVDD